MILALALLLAAQQRTWTVAAKPSVSIGEVEAAQEYMFSQVVGAVRLSDGRLVVANGGSNEVRVYDASGKHLSTLGRAGGGPGEFQTLRALWLLPADTLLAVDARNNRVTVYTPGPTLSRSFQLQSVAGISGRLADGSYLLTVGVAPSMDMKDFQGLIEFNGLVLRRSAEATTVDTVARAKGGHSYVNPTTRRQYPFPFGRTAQIAVAPARFYYADTHSTEVGIYDPTGKRLGSVKLRPSSRPLTDADIEKWIEVDLARRNAAQKLDARNDFKQIPPLKRTPEFAAMKVDDLGNLWVRHYGPPFDPSPNWDVYDANGAPLARVRLPARFDPFHIGRDFLVGVRKDELDVEHIEVYRLTR
jgi:hypothetical protein